MSSYRYWQENGRILFGDASLELAFDSGTGRWLTLRDLQSGDDLLQHGAQQAPETISVNGVSTATMGREEWWSVVDAETVGIQAVCTGSEYTETDRGPMLTVHTREGDWLIDQRYTLPPGEGRIERGLRLEYRGDGEALLRSVELCVPLIHLGPVGECFVEAPGYPTKTHQALGSLPPPGCYFHPRCRYAQEVCHIEEPKLMEISPDHFVSCHRARELSLQGI